MRAATDHMTVTSHPSHTSHAHTNLALATGRARHVRLHVWSHEHLTASPHSISMYPPTTAVSRPATEPVPGPHPRPHRCGRAEEGLWRVQRSPGTHTWTVRSSTDWPGHQLAGHSCHTYGPTLKHVAPEVTRGHWWHPTLRQATALNPVPSTLTWEPLKGQGHQLAGTPNCLSPFLDAQARWGGSEGQDSRTSQSALS